MNCQCFCVNNSMEQVYYQSNLDNVCGIYQIKSADEYIYIGSSKNIKKRLKTHFYELNNNKHINKYLQNKFNQHKIEWSCSLLEEVSGEKLIEREQYYLDMHKENKLLLNLNPIASLPPSAKGIKRSQEYKNKLSNSLKGKKKSKEHCKKMSESMKERYKNGTMTSPLKGIGLSTESLAKKSETIKALKEEGKYKWSLTEEQRNNISKSKKKYYSENPDKKPTPPSRKGCKVSEETKAKISSSWITRRENKLKIIQEDD